MKPEVNRNQFVKPVGVAVSRRYAAYVLLIEAAVMSIPKINTGRLTCKHAFCRYNYFWCGQ